MSANPPPGAKKLIVLDRNKNARDRAILEAIPGFDPNKPCVIEISGNLIGHDSNHQIRVVPLSEEDVEGMNNSMEAIGQKNPYPVFLNPNLGSTRPFLSCGGANRSKALRKAGIEKHWVRYDPEINPDNALLHAALDNAGRSITIQDRVVAMEKTAPRLVKKFRNPDEGNDGVDEAMRVIAPFFAMKPERVKEFYILSLLHSAVKPRLYLKREQEGHLSKMFGLFLAQLPSDKQFETSKAMMQCKSPAEAAKALDDAIVQYGPPSAQRVPNHLTVSAGDKLGATAEKLVRAGEAADNLARDEARGDGSSGSTSGRSGARTGLSAKMKKEAKKTFVSLVTQAATSLSQAGTMTLTAGLITSLPKDQKLEALRQLNQLKDLIRDLGVIISLLETETA